jgi:hypothetical protein
LCRRSLAVSVITARLSDIGRTLNIVLLSLAGVLAAAFVFWMGHQEKAGRTALIPNSLWKNTAFTTICVMVLLSWAVLSSVEYFLSLL